MRVANFDFVLPDELIAKYPSDERSNCRLLVLDGETGQVTHTIFTKLLDQLVTGDLLVFNNTRVIPARLFGHKESGGKVEVLVERILDNNQVIAHIRASKAPRPNSKLHLGKESAATVKVNIDGRCGALFKLTFEDPRTMLAILDDIGHIPLPPYIDRADEKLDRELYQTVYSLHPGAVAAPTAGLHFDQQLLSALQHKGIKFAFVTLHVGAGTFQPVKVENIEQHIMHAEYAEVSQQVVDEVCACKARGNRVVAVGTTSVRCLETAAQMAKNTPQTLIPFADNTQIFIYPGYEYRVVDAMVTNFHLPESTLIMLVSAFAGYQATLEAYQQAIETQYRFFSYGDAMFILRNPLALKDTPLHD